MKKKIIAIIGMMVMLFAITGCNTIKPEPQGELISVAPEERVVHPISLKDMVYEDGILTFTTENNSKEDMSFGEAYRIDVAQEDFTWRDSEMTAGMSFIEIAHIIPANDKVESSIDLSGFEFEPGQYRIARNYTIKDANYDAGVEITVFDDMKISPTVSTVFLK